MTKHILASNILAIWEKDVRPFAPDEHVRWQTLVESLPDDIAPEMLRDVLAPIAAKSDKEQALFGEIFTLINAETADLLAMDTDLSTFQKLTNLDTDPPPSPPGPLEKYGVWIAAVLLLLLTAGLIQAYQREKSLKAGVPAILILHDTVAVNSRTVFRPDSMDLAKYGQIKDAFFYWKQDSLSSASGSYTVDKSGSVVFHADSFPGTDSVSYLLLSEKGAFWIALVTETVDYAPNIQSVVIPGKIYIFTPEDPPFNHDNLVKSLASNPANGFDSFLTRWARWLKAGLLLALAGFLYWFIQWRARRRQKLVAQRDKSAKPPYAWNIHIKNLTPPDPGEAFSLTLNALRRRAEGEARLMDIPATVRATIRKGGMAAFRFKQQTHPPEYLMLVDRQHTHDHRARLYDDLYRVMLQNEVLTERFFFDGDIRLCHNEQYPEGLTPDELLLRFPTHRLLIIGTGRQMISAITGKPAKWAEQFSRWKDRALLSPLPATAWGRREQDLAEMFRFAPASLPGLKWLIEAFESEEEWQAPQFEKLALLAIGNPMLLEDGDLLQTLENQFPDALTRTWLAACALWPELHYDLTLWFGHWLAQESGRAVATMARLGDLLRLPWFATGEMPDPARAVLIDWLRETNPGLENRLRTALHALLNENAPPEDSAAWDDFAMRVAFNEWLITTDPKAKKALEEKLARWIEKNDPDFIVIRELRGKPGPLDSLLPDSWKKRFFKGKLPSLGLKELWRDVLGIALPLMVAAAVGLLGFWPTKAPVCKGEPVMVNDTLYNLCLNSDEKLMLWWEYGMREAARQRDSIEFNKMWLSPYEDSMSEKLAAECRANVANAAYNAGIWYYQKMDSLIGVIPGYKRDTSSLKMNACYWFDQAFQHDTSLYWVRQAINWCAHVPYNQPNDINITRKVGTSGSSEATISFDCYDPNRMKILDKVFNEMKANTQNRLTIKLFISNPARATGAEMWRKALIDKGLSANKIEASAFIEGNADDNNTEEKCRIDFVIKYASKAGSSTGMNTPLPTMIPIKGGTFTMGSPESEADRGDDEKQHAVTLSDFEMSRTEVTVAQFKSFVDATNYKTDADKAGNSYVWTGSNYEEKKGVNWRCDATGKLRPENEFNHPVIHVSWNDAKAYCIWLTSISGKKYRLPTEAEWEYAARGGRKSGGTVYAGSNDIDLVAWYTNNTNDSGTRPVASKKANDLGLFDMSGNVWEWCSDWYGDYEDTGKPVLNPTGAKTGSHRVYRGGSWSSNAQVCRVANRSYDTPGIRSNNLGFRLASSPQ